MRQKCEECGEYALCNEDGVCYGCIQDRYDLEEWLPEEESEEDEVE